MAKNQIQVVRGMHDVALDDQKYWQFIESTFEKQAKSQGFSKIQTPLVEKASLFERTVGEETDIIEKEMYIVSAKQTEEKEDKEEKEILVLRPENTASIARSYIENGMQVLPQPVNLYYMGPMFRHDRPQKWRYRQFTQLGMETIGEIDPIVDAQLISSVSRFLKKLKIKDFSIQINSIGCIKCRAKFIKKLSDYYKPVLKNLCPDCKRRYDKNPLLLLDCKEPACQDIKAGAPQIIDFLEENDQNHFKQVLEYLDELEVPYELNTYLVRGLDYYTRTVFEVWPSDPEIENPGSFALAAGGRYDDLIQMLGGRSTPGIGFALSVERIVAYLKEKEIKVPMRSVPDVFVVQLGDLAKKKSLKIIEALQEEEFKVVSALGKESIKSQLKLADKLKAPLAIILGHKEVLDGTVIIRDMSGGMQEVASIDSVVDEVKKRLPRESF